MKTKDAIERLSGWAESTKAFALRIRRWAGPFWRLITLGLMEGVIMPQKALSVSMERGCTWVVSGSRFLSRIKITGTKRYVVEEGGYAGPEGLASSVVLAAGELKAPKTGITLSVPRDWAIIKRVELPSTVKENIADVISYELDRLTPLTADTAWYDFKIIGEKEEKLSLIIVAVKADMINQYRQALKRDGFEVTRVTINIANLTALCSYMERKPDMVCLEADRSGYEGAFVTNGIISASCGGLFDDENPEGAGDRIAKALTGLLEDATAEGISPEAYISLKEWRKETIEKSFQTKVDFLDDAAIKRLFFTQGDDFSHAAAGGLLASLSSREGYFNLLDKGVAKPVSIPLAGTIVLLLLFIVAWIPYFILPLKNEEKRLIAIDKQISARKEEVKKVEALKKSVDNLEDEVSGIEDFKEGSPMTLALLKELTVILPKTAWFTRVRLTDKTADIEGYAASASEILPKLEVSKYFRKVEFSSPTVRDTRLNADRFVIKMELENVTPSEGGGTAEGSELEKTRQRIGKKETNDETE